MKHILTGLICLILITACERNTKNNTPFSTDDYLHVIDLNKTVPEIPLSEIFASVAPIALETTKNSLIGNIDKVVATPEYLIVLDRSIANALFLFKKDGTFLHKFGRIGGGPGEYSSISNFCYDNTTGTIYMLDFQTNRVNLYDIHASSFLKSIQLQNNNKGYSRFIYYQGGELYTDLESFPGPVEHLLYRRNQTTGEIEDAWFDKKTYAKNIDYVGWNLFLFGDDNSFKINTYFMDGILSFEKGKITPFLTFTPEHTINMGDLKGLNLKNNGETPIETEIWTYMSKINKVFDIDPYFEHKDLIYMEFILGGKFKSLIYSKKTKDFKYVNGREDDLLYKEVNKDRNSEFRQHLSSFIAQDDNGLYAVQRGQTRDNLKKLLKHDRFTENFKSAAIELTNLEEDANPVLLYYEFKD